MICNKCARRVTSKPPSVCLRCRGKLQTRKFDRHDPRGQYCARCAETVVERETDACGICGVPFTSRGFQRMRQMQRDPTERPAYQRQVQGRRVS